MADEIGARVKTPLELDKLTLYATPEPGGRSPRLAWSLIFGNPRITVYTNRKELENKENEWGRITARLDIITMRILLDQLEKVVKGQEEVRYKIVNKNHPIVDGQRSEVAVEVNEIIFGKDKEGMVWISVVEGEKPKIKFNFSFSDYHELRKGDGTSFSASEGSCLAANAYIGILRDMFVNSYYTKEQIDILNTSPEDKKAMFGKKTPYNNNSNKSSGGKAATPVVADFDDLPF
jgi:hypothetical protein